MFPLKALPVAFSLFLAVSASSLAQAPQMPPTPVNVLSMTPHALPVVNELPGRVAATRTAEVRPRVGGIVVERIFEQGSTVEKGDVLYRIEPAPYEVRVASADATGVRIENTDRLRDLVADEVARDSIASVRLLADRDDRSHPQSTVIQLDRVSFIDRDCDGRGHDQR